MHKQREVWHREVLERIQQLGYTDSEARFLYSVTVFSGYFTMRQFRAFTGSRCGKRPACFAQKLIEKGHARVCAQVRTAALFISYRERSTVRWTRTTSPPFPGVPPVITFSHVDPGFERPSTFASHLAAYGRLFQQLNTFRFLYIAAKKATRSDSFSLFNLLVLLGGTGTKRFIHLPPARTAFMPPSLLDHNL